MDIADPKDRKRADDALSRLPGGPAFPIEIPLNRPSCCNPGMSLRDYFAGQALTGLVSRVFAHGDRYAQDAYAIADFMLEERGRG